MKIQFLAVLALASFAANTCYPWKCSVNLAANKTGSDWLCASPLQISGGGIQEIDPKPHLFIKESMEKLTDYSNEPQRPHFMKINAKLPFNAEPPEHMLV